MILASRKSWLCAHTPSRKSAPEWGCCALLLVAVACLEGRLLWEAASSKYSLQCRMPPSKPLLHLALLPFYPTGIGQPPDKIPAVQLSYQTRAEEFSLQSGVQLEEWLTISLCF